MDVGAVCIKTKGRHAGKKVVVLSAPEKGFVMVAGVGVKKKRCNALHLFPLNEKVQVKKDASAEEVAKLLKK